MERGPHDDDNHASQGSAQIAAAGPSAISLGAGATPAPDLRDAIARDGDDPKAPSGDDGDLIGLMGPEVAALAADLPTDDPQKASVLAVASFLRWIKEKGQALTGAEAVAWVRDRGLLAWDQGLNEDAEVMVEVAQMAADLFEPERPDIPHSAFVTAAFMLVASHAVDRWPLTIFVSPQDTINFKSSTTASTLIVDGAPEGAVLFEHGAAPVFRHIALANVIDIYMRDFLVASASPLEAALCRALSAAMADIPTD